MTAFVNLLAPARSTYVTRGASYTPDANLIIANVPVGVGPDLLDLLHDGCIVVGLGTVGTAATGVVAQEQGVYHHVTILTLNTVLPAIAGGASLGVGKLLYTFPPGAQLIKSSRVQVAVTQTQGNINANTPVIGLGSVIASGAISVLSGTGTFQDINVGKAAANCTGTPTVQTVKTTASPFEFVTEVAGSKSLFLNAAAAWSASGDAAALLTGTVSVEWINLP